MHAANNDCLNNLTMAQEVGTHNYRFWNYIGSEYRESWKVIDSIIADGTEIKNNDSNESVYLLGERSKITL